MTITVAHLPFGFVEGAWIDMNDKTYRIVAIDGLTLEIQPISKWRSRFRDLWWRLRWRFR